MKRIRIKVEYAEEQGIGDEARRNAEIAQLLREHLPAHWQDQVLSIDVEFNRDLENSSQ